MPKDQLDNFLSAGYVPLPWQCRFHAAARLADREAGPDAIGCGGARGPGKSTSVFAQVCLDDARRLPGLKVLYLRKVLKQAKEQFDELISSVLRSVVFHHNRQENWLRLWQGSRIYLGHFNHEKDVDNYLGLQYDLIVIEEATTLSATKRKAIRDSLRSSKVDWRPREYNSTNPGGVGHAAYRATFIMPFVENREVFTRFIPATIDDNPLIDAGYKRRLEENTGWRLRAYRFGDWDIAAGQFFTTWSYERHTGEFELDPSWTVWGALDYGHDHPMCFGLLAVDGAGAVRLVDEVYGRGWLPETQAEEIKACMARNKVGSMPVIYAGHDCFAQKGQSALTIAQQFAAAGVTLTRATVDRVSGAAKVLQLLGDERVESRLTIHPRCQRVIETLPVMEHDPGRPEDVLKIDIDEDGHGGDDAYDMLRYGVMTPYVVERVPAVAQQPRQWNHPVPKLAQGAAGRMADLRRRAELQRQLEEKKGDRAWVPMR